MRLLRSGGLLATMTVAAMGQSPPHCPDSSPDLCYRLSIPPATASTGTGPVYFQLAGPTTYSWMALGQGDRMAGAQMFVVYTDARGNVTVSPRLGRGHVMPTYSEGEGANVTLLEGSGVRDEKMIANLRCDSGCESWTGGSMDFTSSSGGWIFARSSGEPMGSSDPNAAIQIHDDHGSFDWDFASARSTSTSASNGNPFPSQPAPPSSSAANPAATSAPPTTSALIIAHATLASLAYILFFPTGAILLRLASFPGLIWVHAGLQIFGYVLVTAAVALGIYAATHDQGPGLRAAHPIIGLVLFGVLFTQPFSGLLHHRLFKKHGTRTWAWWTHTSIGRAAILLGLINGGLGLQWAAPTPTRYYVVYGVFAGLAGAAFLAAVVFGEVKRHGKNGDGDEKGGRRNGDGVDGRER